MECKLQGDWNPAVTRDLELIDTLWNVNKDGCEYVAVDFTELIDTLWNVNHSL